MQFFKLHIVDDYLSLFSKSLFFFLFFLYSYYNIHLHLLINCKWLCDSPIFNFTNRTILFSNFYYCYFRIIFFFLPIIQNFIFWIAIWPTRAFTCADGLGSVARLWSIMKFSTEIIFMNWRYLILTNIFGNSET